MAEFERSSFEATRWAAQPAGEPDDALRAVECCHELLSDRGDISSERLASDAWDAYRPLAGASLETFFSYLAAQFSPDADLIARRADVLRQYPSPEALAGLEQAVEPPRRELFRRLNVAAGGTASLIEMRRRVLRGLPEHPAWRVIADDLEHLLRSWFNAGFLEFKRIDWRTSPVVLENLIKYEAVHHIRDWRELRRRLQDDRRCFAFFHPSLPDEPLIFTELALTSELSSRVQPLLDPDSPVLDAQSRRCAMFYSISSCHDGLRGVSFGNALIRHVVDSLGREFPRLKTFATLSPIPGFRGWLDKTAREGSREGDAAAKLRDMSGFAGAGADELGRTLLPLCASYLLTAKRGEEPADPVARFHLGNGARLERLNWLGDTSEAGIDRSASLTANYLYRLSDVERNHRAYVTERKVIASRNVQRLSHAAMLGALPIAS